MPTYHDEPELEQALRNWQAISPPGQPAGADATQPHPAPSLPPLPEVEGYDILGPIGHGGMGVVYKARDLALGRLVALKMVRLAGAAGPESYARFLLEVRTVAALNHPNIVPIYGSGTAGGQPWFTMELCDGGSLDRLLHGKPLSPRAAAGLVETLAQATHHAHAQHVIHRDLKPSNILQTADGTPKIADFGLAKHLDAGPGLTRPSDALGTPAYMAPEQVDARHGPVGPTTDVYGLGALLYETLTGRPPFSAATPFAVCQLVRSAEPLSPARLARGVPRDLETICLKCLEKNPARRYPSALALAEDLRRFLDGRPVLARRVGPVGRTWRAARRYPAAATALVLVLLTLAAAGVSLGFALRREQAAAWVAALQDASPDALPALLRDPPGHPRARELLIALWHAPDTPPPRRFRAGLALAADPAVRPELAVLAGQAGHPSEVLLARTVLTDYPDAQVAAALWARLDDRDIPEAERLPLLALLAGLDPADQAWDRVARDAAARLLATAPPDLDVWIAALYPRRDHLLAPLREVFHVRDPEPRFRAARALASLAADQPALLVDLLPSADDRQFPLLLAPLAADRGAAVPLLRLAFDRPASHPHAAAPPAALPAGLADPDPAAVQALTGAGGLLEPDFALAPRLPLDQAAGLLDALGRAGYRPVRLRPYLDGDTVFAAILWTRDNEPFAYRLDFPDAAAVEADAAERHARGWQPVDVAGYRTSPHDGSHGSSDRYAALWRRISPHWRGVFVVAGRDRAGHRSVVDHFRNLVSARGSPEPQTCQVFLAADGHPRYCTVWAAPADWQACEVVLDPPAGRALSRPAPFWTILDLGLAPAGDGPPATAVVWQTGSGFESLTADALPLTDLPVLARAWAREGYRPVALAINTAPGRPATALLAARRPLPSADACSARARRRAACALALEHLGDPAPVDTLLLTPADGDPEARNRLVQTAAARGLPAAALAGRLAAATTPARRALILALGEYGPAHLTDPLRRSLKTQMLDWYATDPDPGVHSAIDWLLRHDTEGPVPRPLAWGGRADLERLDAAFADRARAAGDHRWGPPVRWPAPTSPAAAPAWEVNSRGLTFAVLGPASFLMGSPAHEPERVAANENQHRRRLPHRFALATRPVTVTLYTQFLDEHGLTPEFPLTPAPDPDAPVSCVTWFHACQFCNWLSKKDGLPPEQWCYPDPPEPGMRLPADLLSRTGYRLPTEAEYEYACRAGAATPWFCGSAPDLLDRYAWSFGNSRAAAWPVGHKRPNDFGLFDPVGAVAVWCLDRPLNYPRSEDDEPIEAPTHVQPITATTLRSTRGGSMLNRDALLRSACRQPTRPDNSLRNIGLRLARTLSAPPAAP